MNEEEYIDKFRNTLSAFRTEALSAGLIDSTVVTEENELSLRNSGHQSTTIFPFNRKKHMKFERLEDENIIISPYYDCTRAILGKEVDEMNSYETYVLHNTIRSDWSSALTCDYQERVVYLDNIEAHGTLWRLVKVKSQNIVQGLHEGSDGAQITTSMLSSSSSSSNLMSMMTYEHQSKYHLQSCEIGETCMYLTRELEITPHILDAAELVFVPLAAPSSISAGAANSNGTSGKGAKHTATAASISPSNKNNVEDNNVFGCLCKIKLFNPNTVSKVSSPNKSHSSGKGRGKGENQESPDDLYLVSDKLSGLALITAAEFEQLEKENRKGMMSDSPRDNENGGGAIGGAFTAVAENTLQSTIYWDIFPEDISTLKAETLPNCFTAVSEAELQNIFL